jgi:hypothetical protein
MTPEQFRSAIVDYVQQLTAEGVQMGIEPPRTIKELAQLIAMHSQLTGGPVQGAGGSVVPIPARGLRRGNAQVFEAEEVTEEEEFEI